MNTTTLSSKGQIVIPKEIRENRHWRAGARFVVEETAAGVLLRPEQLFPPTRLEDGLGCIGYRGPAKSVEEMRQGVDDEMRRRWRKEGSS